MGFQEIAILICQADVFAEDELLEVLQAHIDRQRQENTLDAID